MTRRVKGSDLVDYIVPIATVGLVFGLALFQLASDGTMIKFIESSLHGGQVDEQGTLNFGLGVETMGSLAGLPGGDDENPVMSVGPGGGGGLEEGGELEFSF